MAKNSWWTIRRSRSPFRKCRQSRLISDAIFSSFVTRLFGIFGSVAYAQTESAGCHPGDPDWGICFAISHSMAATLMLNFVRKKIKVIFPFDKKNRLKDRTSAVFSVELLNGIRLGAEGMEKNNLR
jgi:hypothetical protein